MKAKHDLVCLMHERVQHGLPASGSSTYDYSGGVKRFERIPFTLIGTKKLTHEEYIINQPNH